MALDFDFHYEKGTAERQHTQKDIDNIVSFYANEVKEVLLLDKTQFQIFVMEKEEVNQLADKTKDGIHILINVKMEHPIQEILRENVLPKIKKLLQHLPLINTWEQPSIRREQPIFNYTEVRNQIIRHTNLQGSMTHI